jgi:uncharacterized protein YndB with AHSA1/START domain
MTNVTDIASVVCETRIAARPESVFAFFTEPDKLVRWQGTHVELDPAPGGVFAVDMNPQVRARGTFVEVVPYSRIVFTWGWVDDTYGLSPGSSTVEVTLTPDGEGTHVRLVHRGLTTSEMRDQHRIGWELYLARLTVAAAGGDPGPDPNANPHTEDQP